MTLHKPRLHKPRNAPRPAGKSAARTGRPESAGSPAGGLDLAPAIEALELLLDLSHPADAQLSAFFRNYPNFGARDRSFIAEAVYGVLRRLRSLQVLAAPAVTPRRLLLAWLARHGGRNMREFEALEESAQLDKADLEWLRSLKGAKLEDQSEAVRLDLPDWLHERLSAQYGEHLPTLMSSLNSAAPLDLRVNPLKAERDAVLTQFARENIPAAATPHSPLGIRLQGKPALQKHPLFLDGSVEVQDEGSQLLGLMLAPKRSEMVCDFCAGAGGKTLLRGALMRSQGRLYAFDVAEKRLAKLKPRLARSGLSNVHPVRIESENDIKIKRLAGKLDRVLVDAPCSGLGTLRRNPDLKWRQTPESVAELTSKQAAILHAASALVKKGGRLVYATCSLLDAENDAVVGQFLAKHPEFVALSAEDVLNKQDIDIKCGERLRLLPHRHGTDGFFAAVMERQGARNRCLRCFTNS